MILYGAGGHARVIYDCLLSSDISIKAVFDDDQRIEIFAGLPVLHRYNGQYLMDEQLIIAIGSSEARKKLASTVKHDFGKVIDPTSFIASSVAIGPGSMIMAKSIIQAGCSIGNHVIVNSGAIVEHDTQVEDFCHLGPGSVVCGDVKIGEGALIGANATVLPGLKIGAWSTVGAGAVVIDDVAPGKKVAGNPAKHIES
jgi:sugar O-acyltransferase (sialic acid O-acetyltransferase NeuD family)